MDRQEHGLPNPAEQYPKPPYPKQQQPWPGLASKLDPRADHGGQFNEYIGVPHAERLCAPLADAETGKAFEHVWTLLSDHDKNQFSNAIREKCGSAVGMPAKLASVEKKAPG